MKQYMVVEHFKPGCCAAVYQRFEQRGRLLPDGLEYIDSWVNRERDICFQLMRTAQPALFETWFEQWQDLVNFELTPID